MSIHKCRAAQMSRENIEDHMSDFYLESRKKTIEDFIQDLRRSKMLDM